MKKAKDPVPWLVDHDHAATARRVEQQLMLRIKPHIQNVDATDPVAGVSDGHRRGGLSARGGDVITAASDKASSAAWTTASHRLTAFSCAGLRAAMVPLPEGGDL